jgi:hypothetical protein
VKFQVNHPPLVDMRDINNITIIPPEWQESGEYNYLASNLTQALSAGIKKAKIYNFVDSSVLKNIDTSDYREPVDAYITCEIINVASKDEQEIKEEKDGDETKKKKYVTRTVTVDIAYKYIRTVDNKILGVFNKTAKESVTFDDSDRSSKWWGELLLDIFLPKGTPSKKIAALAVKKFSDTMSRELVPWTTTEKRKIEKSTKKDPLLKEAQKLVKRKKYFEALILYKKIYEETGSVIAGYNTALLLEANEQFVDALTVLENLEERISKMGIDSPPFIRIEAEKVKISIDELRELEYYKN